MVEIAGIGTLEVRFVVAVCYLLNGPTKSNSIFFLMLKKWTTCYNYYIIIIIIIMVVLLS